VLSDSTWLRMVDRFGEAYTMDVIFTVGAYTALAMGLKSCGVQLEARG
jgi:4-carboxymuconolactone decarboxylase